MCEEKMNMCERVLRHSPVSLSRGSNRTNIRQTSNLSPRLVIVSYSHAQSCAAKIFEYRVARDGHVSLAGIGQRLFREKNLLRLARSTDAASRRRKRRTMRLGVVVIRDKHLHRHCCVQLNSRKRRRWIFLLVESKASFPRTVTC